MADTPAQRSRTDGGCEAGQTRLAIFGMSSIDRPFNYEICVLPFLSFKRTAPMHPRVGCFQIYTVEDSCHEILAGATIED